MSKQNLEYPFGIPRLVIRDEFHPHGKRKPELAIYMNKHSLYHAQPLTYDIQELVESLSSYEAYSQAFIDIFFKGILGENHNMFFDTGAEDGAGSAFYRNPEFPSKKKADGVESVSYRTWDYHKSITRFLRLFTNIEDVLDSFDQFKGSLNNVRLLVCGPEKANYLLFLQRTSRLIEKTSKKGRQKKTSEAYDIDLVDGSIAVIMPSMSIAEMTKTKDPAITFRMIGPVGKTPEFFRRDLQELEEHYSGTETPILLTS